MSKYSIITVNGTSPINEVVMVGSSNTSFSTKYVGFGNDPVVSNGSFFKVIKFPFYINSNYTSNYYAYGGSIYGNSGINGENGSTSTSSAYSSAGGSCGVSVNGNVNIPIACTSIVLFMISPGAGGGGARDNTSGKAGSGGMFATYSIPRSKTHPTTFYYTILGGGGGGGGGYDHYPGAGGYPGEKGHNDSDYRITSPKPSQNAYDCYVRYNEENYIAAGAIPGDIYNPGNNISKIETGKLPLTQNSPGISTNSGYAGSIIDTTAYGTFDYSTIGIGGGAGNVTNNTSRRGYAGTGGFIQYRFMFDITV